VVGSAGETGIGGPLVTVFPLRIGLVVFPLVIGLLVFCASAIVIVAVRTRTLRPISSMRFAAIAPISSQSPRTSNRCCNTSAFRDCP
jgi:hypothetical protein